MGMAHEGPMLQLGKGSLCDFVIGLEQYFLVQVVYISYT